ncbi:hypothetical protein BH09PLA1_BH09PLA1_22010 [soil metagenome]
MSRRGITVVDVLIALMAFALASAFCLAQAIKLDDTDARVRCASNLYQIGQTLQFYSHDNRGRFPVTETDEEHPAPTCGTPYEDEPTLTGAANDEDRREEKYRPRPNDVTAALYLALSTQEIGAEAFVCPATHQSPWDFERDYVALDWTNWKGRAGVREHLSYSYQNPYPGKEGKAKGFGFLNNLDTEFVLAADMNPGTDALTKVNLRSSAAELKSANSPNHSREGQNVLFADGHVAFEQNVFVGVGRDNIYTFGASDAKHAASGGEGIIGPPSDKDDTILLPTAVEIGSADAEGNLIEPAKLSGAGAPTPTAAPNGAAIAKPVVAPATTRNASPAVDIVPLLLGLSLIVVILAMFFVLTRRSQSRPRAAK